MRKNDFVQNAKKLIQYGEKMRLVVLAMNNRSSKVYDINDFDYIETRGLKECKFFIDDNFNIKKASIYRIWNFIKGNKPYDVPTSSN